MDCLLKFGLSCTLKGVIQKLLNNKNNYSALVRTDEWSLIGYLDSQIQKRNMCERPCLGCLEFTRVAGMFQTLTKDIVLANDQHKQLLDCLCNTFRIEESDPIALALDLTAAPGYVKSKISSDYISDYEKYHTTIDGAFYSLALDHYSHEQAKHSDTLMSHGDLERQQVISYTPLESEAGQELFYLDQNIISKCADDHNLRMQIVNFRKKSGCSFVYSPYVIEDGIKMSRVRLAEYFNVIREVTDLSMLAMMDGKISFVTEDIEITSDRVLLWRDATSAAEDLKVSKMHFNHWGYSHYARNSRVAARANKNINEFLDSLRPYLSSEASDLDFDDFESDYAIYHRLNAATIEKPFSLDELITRSLSFENETECVELIESLCELLDLINYKTESLSEPAKIRSSLQDVEHLKYAWKANYFVTEDARLRARGEFIYSVLQLKTNFIDLVGLKGKIKDEFKGKI
ncbi:hypothetical protein PSYRMG_11895 [Pseudomonas syringae UMAF0158]|nr:hypothetical protein PSYRMG_11895 [Pseudomonas syringae UMAF0158]